MNRTAYFLGMYRIYRASGHGLVFSIRKAARDALARLTR
jgi:hypothetical protein